MIRKADRGNYSSVNPHSTGGTFDGVEIYIPPKLDIGLGHRVLLLPVDIRDTNWVCARLSTAGRDYRLPTPEEMRVIGKNYREINSIFRENFEDCSRRLIDDRIY